MTKPSIRKIKLALALLIGAVLLATPPALAQRVSLNDLDAKLDLLLAQGGGFDVANHVVLKSNFASAANCQTTIAPAWHRVDPNGGLDVNEFVVPAGKNLVITRVSWSLDDGPTSIVVGRTVRMNLFSQETNGSLEHLFQSAPWLNTSENANSRGGTSENVSGGIVVGENRHLCATVNSSSLSGANLNQVSRGFIRGVLIPAP